jgi:hypothetical protein
MSRASHLASLTVLLGLSALAPACATTPPAGHDEGEGLPGERTATTSSAITSDDALSRAEQWVTAKLLYCQSPNGQPDPDTSCPATCERESNPQWDPYRSDCSGFVSWAWDLPAPGRVTSEFAPFETDITTAIQASDLQPGDACNLTAGGHIVLFVQWVTPGKTAVFMEEPGCAATPDYAHEFQSDVTINGVNIDIAYEGESFTAIRYTQLTQSPADAGAAADAGTADAGGPGEGAGSDSGTASHDAGGAGSGSSGGGPGAREAGAAEGGASGQDSGSWDQDSPATKDSGGGCDLGGPSAPPGGRTTALILLGLAALAARKRR